MSLSWAISTYLHRPWGSAAHGTDRVPGVSATRGGLPAYPFPVLFALLRRCTGGRGGGGSVRMHCVSLPSPLLLFTVCVCSLCVVALALLLALAVLLAVIV